MKYISIDQEVMNGVPCFTGTGIPVDMILSFLSNGDSIGEILNGYTALTEESILGAKEENKLLNANYDKDVHKALNEIKELCETAKCNLSISVSRIESALKSIDATKSVDEDVFININRLGVLIERLAALDRALMGIGSEKFLDMKAHISKEDPYIKDLRGYVKQVYLNACSKLKKEVERRADL